MECGICGTRAENFPAVTRYPGRREQYYRCFSCRSIFLFPLPERPSNAAFEDHPSAERLAGLDDQRLDFLNTRVDWIARALGGSRRPPRLLDVGCGSGRFLHVAWQRGWRVEGLERSVQLIEQARRNNPEIPIHQADILEWSGGGEETYDVVVALDVIEHVASPAELLRRLRRLLQPGGLLLLQTPNARSLRAFLQRDRWNMLIPEYHFSLFTAESLRGLLKASEFHPIGIRTTSGTGRETGILRAAARLKESTLSLFLLGNALVALATTAE